MDQTLQGLGSLLPGEAWRALLSGGIARRYDAGDVMLRQGDPGTHVLVLTAGKVKVVRVEPDGTELLLAVRGPGEVIGEIAVLDGSGRSATVTALSVCVTYILSAERFSRIIDRFDLRDVLMRLLLRRYREGEDIRVELAGLPAFDRVVRILLRLAEVTHGSQRAVDLSQDELASAMGLSRSAVAAELAELRRLGHIATSRRRIMIRDLSGLTELTEGRAIDDSRRSAG
ncbi:Crp/Fnr family transcriptional regulator [Streptosporangium oxazolinicum]|uniref:Crp/Fnr family transcriptional regulator n=1 Tax=Streptosporangium oxazolinicum TaxID=909287 RepID=A0ABP8B9G2_9ACTN